MMITVFPQRNLYKFKPLYITQHHNIPPGEGHFLHTKLGCYVIVDANSKYVAFCWTLHKDLQKINNSSHCELGLPVIFVLAEAKLWQRSR